MNAPGSGGGKVFGRFAEPAHQVLDQARAEAERAGHRYLGATGPLLAGLKVDLGRLQEAVAAELRGSPR